MGCGKGRGARAVEVSFAAEKNLLPLNLVLSSSVA
jgi:hypothetical protein